MAAEERFSAHRAPGEDPTPAVLAALDAAERFGDAAGLAARDAARLAVLVEELVGNALRHGAGRAGVRLELVLTDAAGGIALTLTDDGRPFDPSAERRFAGPDPATGGGVGLVLVKAWGGQLAYRREADANRLSLLLPTAG